MSKLSLARRAAAAGQPVCRNPNPFRPWQRLRLSGSSSQRTAGEGKETARTGQTQCCEVDTRSWRGAAMPGDVNESLEQSGRGGAPWLGSSPEDEPQQLAEGCCGS